jgi:hypothetical protein
VTATVDAILKVGFSAVFGRAGREGGKRVAGPTSKRSLIRLLKGVVGVAVLIAVSLHVRSTWLDLKKHGELPKVDVLWFLIAIAAYLFGLVIYSAFYIRVLAASPAPIRRIPGVRAYVVSHLGKYVPGKALVVVMRAGMSASAGSRASTAAFATIYETLVMMAVGGLVAAVCLSFGPSPAMFDLPKIGPIPAMRLPLGLIGLAMGLGFLVLVSPPIFPRLSALARLPFRDLGPTHLPRTSWRLLIEGAAITLIGWVALGFSQIAILRAISPAGVPVSVWPSVIGSVALATVAGFAVPVSPGGLGVREWVLWTSLGSTVDKELAVLAALGLRAAWLISEVVAGLVLLLIRPAPPCPSGAVLP